jgi:hypothetical protein
MYFFTSYVYVWWNRKNGQEVILTPTKTLSQHSLGELQENHDKMNQGASRRLETGTFQIPVTDLTAYLAYSISDILFLCLRMSVPR